MSEWRASSNSARCARKGTVAAGVVAAGAAPPARSVALLLLPTVALLLLLLEELTVLPAEGLQLAEALLAGQRTSAEAKPLQAA
ncbi:hypothetical protein ACKKBF_B41185 [Auxenochlorella protothecoides x Auxenochlorella symbiontica]